MPGSAEMTAPSPSGEALRGEALGLSCMSRPTPWPKPWPKYSPYPASAMTCAAAPCTSAPVAEGFAAAMPASWARSTVS